MSEATLISYDGTLTRDQLALVATPPSTETHRPIPHRDVVDALIETLGFRHIAVHRDEYAVSKDGMKMFGIMELETTFSGCRFAIGEWGEWGRTDQSREISDVGECPK